jgi:uncharacterized protein
MNYKVRKKQIGRELSYRYFIYIIIIIALLQLLALRAFYQSRTSKLPDNLFVSSTGFPISEQTLETNYGEDYTLTPGNSDTGPAGVDSEIKPDEPLSEDSTTATENHGYSNAQKDIILKTLELLDKDIEYGYELFPDTGYPTGNVWISTDLISITLNNCGYNLMELIYDDMVNHKEDYPLDAKGRQTPIKYIDFRDVLFQEKFFTRNALTTLPHEYNLNDENLDFLWQPGDIVYFRFDENNHDKDRGGFISSNNSSEGVPLVIMISPDTNELEEINVLQEYEIVGHYRYPPPEFD